jgi:hypothetical protein
VPAQTDKEPELTPEEKELANKATKLNGEGEQLYGMDKMKEAAQKFGEALEMRRKVLPVAAESGGVPSVTTRTDGESMRLARAWSDSETVRKVASEVRGRPSWSPETGACRERHFARRRDVRGRVLVCEHRRYRAPQPGKPFECPRRREHGVNQCLVCCLGRPGTAGTSQRRSDMDDLTEANGAQAIAVLEPFEAKVARFGHQAISGMVKTTYTSLMKV